MMIMLGSWPEGKLTYPQQQPKGLNEKFRPTLKLVIHLLVYILLKVFMIL